MRGPVEVAYEGESLAFRAHSRDWTPGSPWSQNRVRVEALSTSRLLARGYKISTPVCKIPFAWLLPLVGGKGWRGSLA